MAKKNISFGILLILLGIISYIITNAASITALIPTFFGIALVLLGYAALNPQKTKTLMHIAVIVALLGFIGSVRGLFSLPDLFSGTAARPEAVIAQSVMALLCGILVYLSVRSFIDSRKSAKN